MVATTSDGGLVEFGYVVNGSISEIHQSCIDGNTLTFITDRNQIEGATIKSHTAPFTIAVTYGESVYKVNVSLQEQ